MFNYTLNFDAPMWLWLLLALPVLWVFSYRSLSGLGNVRRIVAISLRTIVFLLIVGALAETQLRRSSDRLSVIYLLDQSQSIPAQTRQAMVDYVVQAVAEHRDPARGDRAGVIVFARDAAIEIPPYDDDLPLAGSRLDALLDLDTDATNLAGALKLAQASFADDAARRIVVVTDGNENVGDAHSIAQQLADSGIGFDAVSIPLAAQAEIAVEKVTLPEVIRKGQPLEARVVLNNLAPPEAGDRKVRGTVRLLRRAGDYEEVLAEQPVELPPGKRVYAFEHKIEQADFYTYEARFIPEDARDDFMSQNNRATAFTHVKGQGHVLLIEDWANPGEFEFLVSRLRAANIEVTVQTSDQPYSSLAELQRYDTVVLANCPRTSGELVDKVTSFSDEQIEMLVRNTQQMGAGIVMIGGNNAFGAGGWSNTELEKAMPVDFQIYNAKVVPVGALVLVMHACEMPQGNHWQKVVSREAIKALGNQDYCGLVQWDDAKWKEGWLWAQRQNGMAQVGPNRKLMLGRLDKMVPGDMPEFEPAMAMSLTAFNKVPQASVKHMIIISDGDPSPPRWGTVRALANLKVKCSTVAIGTHGAAGSMGNTLQRIATMTGGKYYVVTNPKALPRIFQREARRVARPLVYEQRGLIPQVTRQHEILRGIDDPLPPINGFVLTSKKDNPLVEVSIVSPKPNEKNGTILASWNYGLGRTAVFTSDAGRRWATDWTGWGSYDKLFSQLVRWSMRPTGDTGKFNIATNVEDGKVKVVVNALDKDDEFLNFLNISGSAVGPDMQPADVKLRQVAPGRYIGEFDATQSGSYFVTLMPGPGRAPIRAGVTVPYSAEFREQQTNEALLLNLSSLQPKGGEPGEVLAGDFSPQGINSMLQVNPFRHNLMKAVSGRDVWPWLLVMAACVFFADVFIRRVTIGFEWLSPLYVRVRDFVLRRKKEEAKDERLERLRSRKQEIASRVEQQRAAAARFEPQPDADVSTDVLTAGPQPTDTAKPKPPQPSAAPEAQQDDYTSRLLKAKRKAMKDRGK